MHLYLHRAFFTWLEGVWAEELDKESTERHRRTRMMYTHTLDWSLQCEMQLKQASEGSRDIGSLKGRTQNRSNWTEIYVQCFTAMYRWKISIKKMAKHTETHLKGSAWWSHGYNAEKLVALDVMVLPAYLEGNPGSIRNRALTLFREIFTTQPVYSHCPAQTNWFIFKASQDFLFSTSLTDWWAHKTWWRSMARADRK